MLERDGKIQVKIFLKEQTICKEVKVLYGHELSSHPIS